MPPTAALASTAAAAMAHAAPKKPWRYYYVMAFPLSNAPSKDKLGGMLEMTDTIERREEAYLQRMLDRDAPPARDERASPLAKYTAFALSWLSVLMALAALATLAGIYRLQVTSMGNDLDPRELTAAYAVAAGVLGQNVLLIVAVRMQSTLLLRGCVLLLSVSIGGVVFLLDEMDSVLFSQQQLKRAMDQPRSAFQDAQIALVLNGGDAPSLWHRFFVDGPAWFLLWIERHCVAKSQRDGDGSTDADVDTVVDASDFFTPLWEPNALDCTRASLSTHLQIEAVLRVLLRGAVVAVAAQLTLALLVLWIDQLDLDDGETIATTDSSGGGAGRVAISRKRKRRRRQQTPKQSGGKEAASGFPLPVSFFGIVRVACLGLALTGGLLTTVALTLLRSCSFVGATESWTLALVTAFGVLQMLTALCTVFQRKQQLVESLLVGGLALESYIASRLTAFCQSLSTSPSPAVLQDAYDMIFQQTCQPMKHWRSHVCVLMDGSPSAIPHGVAHVALHESPACQGELAALLDATAQRSLALLSWIMAAQTIVLVWLLLPSVRGLLQYAVAFLCRSSSKGEPSEPLIKDLQQQTSQELIAKAKLWKHATLSLADARRVYLLTMKRSDAQALRAEVQAFDAEWGKMTSSHAAESDASVIFTHQFEAIVRTLVLRRLTVQCKLDISLSVSRDGTKLLARIFASDNLLMTTLCQCGPSYKLQLADAVDPGDAFWKDPREIKNDAKVLDAHTVHQKFKLLQLHGVVTRREAEIFPTESLSRVSARVHALMRIHRWRRGTLVVANRHAPFVEYRPQRQLQYLYKRYPNRLDTAATAQQRRAAVLRTIDCLRLTRGILDAEFDLDLMIHHGLVHAFTELHSASRFDATSRESLLASWVTFWKPQHLPGEPTPQAHWLWNALARVSPFRQPLPSVRDYFGECLAFYFAWLAFYSQWLLLATAATTLLLATQTLDVSTLQVLAAFCTGGGDEAHATAFTMSTSATAFGLAIVAWGTAFAKSWERRSVWYQLEWGMDDDLMNEAEAAPDRANFRGVRRRNPITQQWETHFPGHIRLQRQVASALLIVCAGGAHLLVCLLLLLAQGLLAPWLGLRLAVGGSCLAIALLMLWNGDAISALAHRLSEWENYQSERDFQRGVITKVSALQFFNAYGPLLLVAFGLYHTTGRDALPMLSGGINAFHTHVAPYVSVVVELQLLLALVFATRITSHVLLMVHGLLQESLRVASASDSSPPSVESELALQAYRGSYEDYTEIVVQLGLVAMFSGIFPLAPLLAFAECALELRLDALDLCLFLQRPTPDPAGGIGPWTSCVRGVLALAAVVNLALLYFAADNYADWSGVRRVGAFLASALVAYVVAELVWLLVPSHSRDVQRVHARRAFLVERYFGGGGGGDGGTQKEKAEGDKSILERRALETTGDGEDGNGDEEDAEAAPAHYSERLALLRRLNTALRRRDESLEPETAEATAPSVGEEGKEEEEEEEEEEGEEEEEDEGAVVGYFVRGIPPPQPAASEIPPAADEAEATSIRTVESHARTALAGLTAIHVATERERFDFAQDSGWQQQDQQQAEQGARRGSVSQSLSRRFSYFRKRRASTADAELPPNTGSAPATATTATAAKASEAPTKRRGSVAKTTARQKTARKAKATGSRESSSAELPVVQLSGLEAVHEAARRDQLDFSTDPWRAREDAAAP